MSINHGNDVVFFEMTSTRTPSEHRAAVDKWRKTAPANDSDIFGKRPKAEAPRHRGLGATSGLLAFLSAINAYETELV